MVGFTSRAAATALFVALALASPLGLGGADSISTTAGGSRSPTGAAWAGWEFVMGEWIGEGTGRPGEGTGGFSFAAELGGTTLMRRSHADYPAVGGKPAYHHQDLMLVYRESGEAEASALYLDNEGHVIHYAARAAARGDTVTFLRRPVPGAPRYRFVYVKGGERTLKFSFEIAPPARPEAFSTYLTGSARRKAGR